MFPPADCPRPQGSGNVVLTDEALLLNNFPEGTSVTFECANGYFKVSGTGTATCTAKGWTDPDLDCSSESQLPFSVTLLCKQYYSAILLGRGLMSWNGPPAAMFS